MWLKKLSLVLLFWGIIVYLKPGLTFPDGSTSMELKEPFTKISATRIAIYPDRIEIYGKPYFISQENILYIDGIRD
jgi:hypothetical protein